MEEINIYELQKLWEKYPGRSGPRNYPKKKEEKAMEESEIKEEEDVPSWWTEMIHENEKNKEKMKKYKSINKKQREEIRNLYAMMQLERESFYEDIDGIEFRYGLDIRPMDFLTFRSSYWNDKSFEYF